MSDHRFYRNLLLKYMTHVMSCESISFLNSTNGHGDGVSGAFSDHESFLLRHIERESMKMMEDEKPVNGSANCFGCGRGFPWRSWLGIPVACPACGTLHDIITEHVRDDDGDGHVDISERYGLKFSRENLR